jgi:hypothetical protein
LVKEAHSERKRRNTGEPGKWTFVNDLEIIFVVSADVSPTLTVGVTPLVDAPCCSKSFTAATITSIS